MATTEVTPRRPPAGRYQSTIYERARGSVSSGYEVSETMATAEIAERLGLTASAVKGRTFHAQWFLRKHLERIKSSHVAVRSVAAYVAALDCEGPN